MCDAAEHGGRAVRRRTHVLREVVQHLGDAFVGTVRRIVPATLCPMRSAARSPSVDALNVVPKSSVSRSPPTDFQKKNSAEIR